MEKITVKGKILQKVRELREIKELNKEHAIELDTEEGRKLFIVKKTDERIHESGAKIERFLLRSLE